MPQAKRAISALHALTIAESDFCRIYLGFGETNFTEAYRRAFWPPDPDREEEAPDPKSMSRLAKTLLKQEYIQAALAELKRSAGDAAREVLVDQAKFGTAGDRRRAAEQILGQEDKHRFRDAVEKFWEITSEAGAEIVVPLPQACHECGAQLEVSARIADLFNDDE